MGIKTQKALRLISKLILILIGAGLAGFAGYSVYKSITIKPQNIVVTNITEGSATITWTTNAPMKGVVYYAKEKKVFAGPLGIFGTKVGLDDRDVSLAQTDCVNAYNKKAKETKDANFGVDEIFDCNKIAVTQVGSYYTHSVTIKELDENTTYNFVIGDGVWSFEASVSNVKTFSTLDSIGEPMPVFGRVVGDDGTYSTDGLVYITFNDGSEGKDSLVYSSTTNDSGGWYLDASNVRDVDGNIMPLEITNDSFKMRGLLKNYGSSEEAEYILGYFNGAYPDILVKKNIVESISPFDKFIMGAYASGCDGLSGDAAKVCNACANCSTYLSKAQINAIASDKTGVNETLKDLAKKIGYGNAAKISAALNGEVVFEDISLTKNYGNINSLVGATAKSTNALKAEDDIENVNITYSSGQTRGFAQKVVTATCTNGLGGSCGGGAVGPDETPTQEFVGAAGGAQLNIEDSGSAEICNPYNNTCHDAKKDSDGVWVTKDNYCYDGDAGFVAPGSACSLSGGKCTYGRCVVSTHLSPAVQQAVTFTSNGDGTVNISCATTSCLEEDWTAGIQQILPTGAVATGGTIVSVPINPASDLMEARNNSNGNTVSTIQNLIEDNPSYRAMAYTQLKGAESCVETNCPNGFAAEVIENLCLLFDGSINTSNNQCVGFSAARGNGFNLVSKAYASEEASTIYLPDYGMYSFQLGNYTMSTSVSSGKTIYLFYIETNGQVGFQMPVDINNPTTAEDTVLNSNGYEISYIKESTAQQYEIQKGINIISFDFIPVSTDLGAYTAKDVVKQALDNGIELQYIATFEGGRWSSGYSCSSGTCTGENFTIVPGKGYLVYATMNGTLTIPGYKLNTSVPIAFSAGWNLIGVHGYTTAYTARSFIDSINKVQGLVANNVSWWPTAKSKYEGLQIENGTEYGLDFPISPNNGYFVKISSFVPSDTKCKSLVWNEGGSLNGTCGNTK
jgi:hypothetical protein